jgi:signal transduction histidine kinase/CheY-like chemotaxis protein
VQQRRTLEGIAAVLGIATAVWWVAGSSVVAPVREMLRDTLIRLASYQPPPVPQTLPDVALVAIDAHSLRARPNWPFPRDTWAQLIGTLDAAGAVAISFDIDFSTSREHDAAFARAIQASGRVVLGTFSQTQQVDGAGVVELESRPNPVLLEHVAALGGAVVDLDRDGSVRRVKPVQRIREKQLASLALATLGVAAGVDPPGGEPRSALLDFRRVRPEIPVLSLADVLDGHFDPERVRGRAVFVGATAMVLQDLWTTPVALSLPGVMIHAIEYRHHAAELAGQRALQPLGPAVAWFLLVLISAAAWRLGESTERIRVLGLAAIASILPPLGLASTILLSFAPDLLAPLVLLAVHYALGLERVRDRMGRRLREREQSMQAIIGVGKIASRRLAQDSISSALQMLGEAGGARALTLLTLSAEGQLETEAMRWSRGPSPQQPCEDAVLNALSRRELKIRTEGKSVLAYVPLVSGGQCVGALVAEYARARPPLEAQLGMLHVVGSQLALVLFNERLLVHMRAVMEQAQTASRAKTQFLANMSHEIRTPMTAMLGYLDMVRDEAPSAERRVELIDAIQRNGEHMLEVLNDILDYSQLQSGQTPLEEQEVDPRDLCREVEQLLRASAEAKDLLLEVVVDASVPPRIVSDAVRLRQVLVNLVGNAIKFSEKGRVALELAAEDEMLTIHVADEGIGIAAEHLESIFGPFVQVDITTTRAHGGTGLGLAIASRLVKLMGGEIRVASTPGKGTTFDVRVPACRPQAAPATSEPALPEPAYEPAAEGEPIRVLLAEDSPDSQRIFRHLLTRAGFSVEVVGDGLLACEHALAAVDAGAPFHVILMDMDMPELDGYGAAARLRGEGLEVPIVALTAHALPTERGRCLAAGCTDYASKPIGKQDLIELVHRHAASAKEIET